MTDPEDRPHRFERTFGDWKFCAVCDRRRSHEIHQTSSLTSENTPTDDGPGTTPRPD
jgi:hypothetical protein